MIWDIVYYQRVLEKDLPALDKSARQMIRKAIEERLQIDPIAFGKPLRHELAGHKRLRVGRYRIIYEVVEADHKVVIKTIEHRKDVYH